MVTCKVDSQAVAIPKMNSVRSRKPTIGSNSSGVRLLEAEHLESGSSVSRNSIYKLKIDLMYDDSRSVRLNQLDDPHGSRRTRSIIMYNRSELASTAGESTRSMRSLLNDTNEAAAAKALAMSTQKNMNRLSNSVQEQIEQLFTDVAKDATSSFAVVYLGSLPLKDKVTSLQGLQEPLRELYLGDMANEHQLSGHLDICASGLRVKINEASPATNAANPKVNYLDENITPFHNIAVWSAVKFVMSEADGGAAFLPLITDPENIDKSMLFQPLSASEQSAVAKSSHAPIFAVVMRSSSVPKVLECHGFLCRSTEDAIVIAATLYQSLMTHVNSSTHRSTKQRTPRNQNGVSCISIASSSAMTGSNYLSRSQLISSGRKSSFRSTTGSVYGGQGGSLAATPSSARTSRKKRVSGNSLSASSNVIDELVETTTEERKRKSHKTKRAPPVPATNKAPSSSGRNAYKALTPAAVTTGNECCVAVAANSMASRNRQSALRKLSEGNFHGADLFSGSAPGPALPAAAAGSSGAVRQSGKAASLRPADTNGDILTRVAIPRSGSFLNTSGLTRYKSRAARRHSGKLGGFGPGSFGGGGGGGGGELFNEFRLQENLHSLDDILCAIINADGMSYNDLKPIYKEFLMKLAVSLTGDELFQHSKNIMRRQRKKKLKKKPSSSISAASQKKPRTLIFGTKSLKKVFQFGQFRSCRGKPVKPGRGKRDSSNASETRAASEPHHHQRQTRSSHVNGHGAPHRQQRSRMGTSSSDVSVVRHENAALALNRNSSSGYVSCSECSYDSEACTCASADRCYCSLKNDHKSRKLLRKQHNDAAAGSTGGGGKPAGAGAKGHHDNGHHHNKYNNSNAAPLTRDSLISCKSEDKCYCSMADEDEPPVGGRAGCDASDSAAETTTWCDTDSCVSASKCYCQRTRLGQRSKAAASGKPGSGGSGGSGGSRRPRQRSAGRKPPTNKLALDYELFNINGNSKSVQPHEALSVKKSVEAAAVFADMKLSQTTDIKSICASVKGVSSSVSGSCRSYAPLQKQSSTRRREDACSIDRGYERHTAVGCVGYSTNSSQRSCSADDLLNKLNAMENLVAAATAGASIRSGCSHKGIARMPAVNYQSMRAVNQSLEDTLGYLP